MNNKLILTSILIVTIVVMSYFLHMYNYNEAEDVMSMKMPDFMLVYAQSIVSEDDKTLFEELIQKAMKARQQELNLRGNESTRDAPEPIIFNSIPEGDIPPMPMNGQMMIEIWVSGSDGNRNRGWTGNVAYKNGQNIVSFDGVYRDYILVNCGIDENYAMSFQKTDADGHLSVTVWYNKSDVLTGSEILDEAETEAAFGIVQLSGTCN